jgi:hypothetical protein
MGNALAGLFDPRSARLGTVPLIFENHFRTLNLKKLISRLLRKPLPFARDDLIILVECVAANTAWNAYLPMPGILAAIGAHSKRSGGIAPELVQSLRRLRDNLRTGRRFRKNEADANAIDELIGENQPQLRRLDLEPGEAWSDAVIADLAEKTPEGRARWIDLLLYARTAEGARPSKKWMSGAAVKIQQIGESDFCHQVAAWLPLIAKPRTEQLPPPGVWHADKNLLISEAHADLLKGLAWTCGQIDNTTLARALGDTALAGYKKIPFHGPRCVKVANAAVTSLISMPGTEGTAQLGRLAAQVKHPSSRKYMAKALDRVAHRTGQSAADIVELALPTFGLDNDGSTRRQIGNFSAEIRITGSGEAALRWQNSQGKALKSIPAEAKREHADAVKDMQRTVKDIAKMLPSQKVRIERHFMNPRQWPLQTWRERYFDHPLVSNLSRRLVWEFMSGSITTIGAWLDQKLVDQQDRPLDLNPDTVVRLWHPITASEQTVLAWRHWLERHGVSQPFKQAHREIYILTDAEQQTATYSNRFAAHILRQHQFAALCQARGWSYRLQGSFDSHNNATLLLPEHNLRVEYWIEPGDEQQTSGSGIYLYISTDQVRFHPLDSPDALPIINLSPLLFSEVMRDVDLFVGVASVGNDPTWQDRGELNAFHAYWRAYCSAELGESAKTRKLVLERLIPRLAIASRCTLLDKFLVVRGDVRTYKIHLGSGNVMMEPNDQYLCIVPSRGPSYRTAELLLPFEGDITLSVIISKAMMLAADAKIKDESILRQIRHAQ